MNVLNEIYPSHLDSKSSHDIRSVTKIVTALSLGIAIDLGYVESADNEVVHYLVPSQIKLLKSREIKGLSFKSLLSMTSGFNWYEWGNAREYSNWWQSSNQLEYLFNRDRHFSSKLKFNYNSAGSHLAGVALAQSIKTSLAQFAQKYLFDPLAIQDSSWEMDRQGFNNGASGLTLKATDMQKIGNLLLTKGLYKDHRIVSKEWVDKMLTPQVHLKSINHFAKGYGLHTWLNLDSTFSYYYAMGYGGQLILVVPERKIVITGTCLYKGVPIRHADNHWETLMQNSLKLVPSIN